MILFQCLIIIFLVIFSFICFVCCCRDKNDQKRIKDSKNETVVNYERVDVNNFGDSTIKNNDKKQGISIVPSNSAVSLNSVNISSSSAVPLVDEPLVTEPLDKIDNDIYDINDEIENSFEMRQLEEKEKEINHEKNVYKKLQKKINKANNNASDDEKVEEWKIIKQGKFTEMKKKIKNKIN